ncbi:alpha subunit of pyruvate dehydrogenase [Mycoemilia scoparia]|uniref:Pyruvate dehydrogenase E1 component subunit alpha n=1 Tax=Mycoemilia scoparia TaxID=417184 RepID=A0A9W8DLX6_9FUNG|nr:alpha subunit of pyruvate dehydrogenase [Mycoemilia scoparia]
MFRPVSSLASTLARTSKTTALFGSKSAIRGFASASLPLRNAGSVSFTLPEDTFEGYNIDTPSREVTLTNEEAINMYTELQRVRRLEMAADASYKSKLIRGFCHLCIGQEAVPVGIEFAISKEDAVITSYRCHGFTYTRGGTPHEILAELMGRHTGISKGKGGSMHMFTPNFFGGNGIVGAQVPLGAGIAFSQKYLGKNACTINLYGDGAANQGQVFETYNMAKLWNLPVIFVCENNKYGMGTAASRAAANSEYHTRCEYIPGIKANGMDILAVRRAIEYAREHCLFGKGPIILELSTYRYGGHSMSDPGTTYRTREEVQHMRSTRDPISSFKMRLIESGVATEEQIKSIDKDAKKMVDQALAQAKQDPEPPISDLFNHVYAPGTEVPSLRGRVPEETHYFNQ